MKNKNYIYSHYNTTQPLNVVFGGEKAASADSPSLLLSYSAGGSNTARDVNSKAIRNNRYRFHTNDANARHGDAACLYSFYFHVFFLFDETNRIDGVVT